MNEERKQFIEELKLRKLIRKGIKVIKERRQHVEYDQIADEAILKSIIKDMILSEAGKRKNRYGNTGLNHLDELLERIIPILEDDYKTLETDVEQRESFRAHIINAVENILAPEKVNAESDPDINNLVEQDIRVSVDKGEEELGGPEDPEEEDPMFIDVDRPGKREKEEREKEEAGLDRKPSKEDAEREKFSIEGEDETGRNDAYTSFKKIRNQIIDAYSGLSNEKDKNIFYDYLIANLKLYFDRFEEELQTTVEEPSSEIYNQQTGGGEGPPPEGAAPPVEDPGLPPLQESNTYEFNENDLFKLIK
mgnify:CR=1 FL=1